jgi:hypothetical protein
MTTLEALCHVFSNGLKRVGGSGAIGFQLAFFLLPFFFLSPLLKNQAGLPKFKGVMLFFCIKFSPHSFY